MKVRTSPRRLGKVRVDRSPRIRQHPWQGSNVPRIGDDDQFESRYMSRLLARLTEYGAIPVTYQKDRAGLDVGAHVLVEGPTGWTPTQVRVWFQVKGKKASTLPLVEYEKGTAIGIRVPVDHLRFWYAAPEPVYLAVYVEAADEFVAEDIRDVVDRQWPGGTFYAAVPESQDTVTVALDSSRVIDERRVREMLSHRSMRVDGPAFRGRPLGHRFDPLRSRLAVCTPDLFIRLATRLLDVHDFRPNIAHEVAPGLRLVRGRLYQTLEWQSPAFSEYGVGPDDDFRDEPPVDFMHGDVVLLLDSAPQRQHLSIDDLDALRGSLRDRPATSAVAVLFNGPELSGTRGLWRSTLVDQLEMHQAGSPVHLLGLESVTSLLLVATLVYLDFAGDLSWDHVNYQ